MGHVSIISLIITTKQVRWPALCHMFTSGVLASVGLAPFEPLDWELGRDSFSNGKDAGADKKKMADVHSSCVLIFNYVVCTMRLKWKCQFVSS